MSNKIKFALDRESGVKLEELRHAVHANSKSDVICRALTLLKLAAESGAAGGKVVLRASDGTEREVFLG